MGLPCRWTNGDGTDLVTVDMPGVGRVCALLCWEVYILLARWETQLVALHCPTLASASTCSLALHLLISTAPVAYTCPSRGFQMRSSGYLLVLPCRYTLYAQGCEFMVVPTQDIGPVWSSTISFVAREGRVRCVLCKGHGSARATAPQGPRLRKGHGSACVALPVEGALPVATPHTAPAVVGDLLFHGCSIPAHTMPAPAALPPLQMVVLGQGQVRMRRF